MPLPRTRPLWPVLVGVAVAAATAAGVAAVALAARRDPGREAGALAPMRILVAVQVHDRVLRAVTEEGGCRRPVFAHVRVRGRGAELRVMGQDPGGGCTAEIKIRCNELRWPAARGKPWIAITARGGRVSDKILAREYAGGPCPRLPLRWSSAMTSSDHGRLRLARQRHS